MLAKTLLMACLPGTVAAVTRTDRLGRSNSSLALAPRLQPGGLTRQVAVAQAAVEPAHQRPEPAALLDGQPHRAAATGEGLYFVPRRGGHPGSGGDPRERPARLELGDDAPGPEAES